MLSHRSSTAVFGLLAWAIGALTSAGCSPMWLTRTSDADGKVTSRYLYENGWPWSGRAVVSPPPAEELRSEILAIVPMGTRRPVVLRRLKAAGIQGSFGTRANAGGGRVPRHDCYSSWCWKRPNGKVWLVDIVFFFDEAGKLHRIEFSRDPSLRPNGTERGTSEVVPKETIDADNLRPDRDQQRSKSGGSEVGEREHESSQPVD